MNKRLLLGLIVVFISIQLVTAGEFTQSYDFGGGGGIFASRCQGGSLTPDDSLFYDNPCPNDFAFITTDTDLDTSDDNRELTMNTGNTDDGFTFPVPIDDIGNATFLATDKAIVFMRYIRKYKEEVEKNEL